MKKIREMPYYRPLLWSAAAFIVLLMIWIGRDLVTNPDWINSDDYVEYWAAGKLNITGGNPYDPEQLLPLQQSTGKEFGLPVMMWNPPWMLTFAMPFGSLDYPTSRTIWLLAFIVLVFLCVNSLWVYFGGNPRTRYISWIIGFSFFPVLEALKSGQANPLLLLGITGFLLSVDRKRYFLGGIFISFLILKPHLLYLFGLAAVLWLIQERRWSVFLGVIASLSFGTVVAWFVNPQVISQYVFAIQNYPPTDWATPTVGGILRLLISPDMFWLQFVPPFIGAIWFVFYWLRKRAAWKWNEQASLLILVSVFTAAYGWSSDQIVSVVALIEIGVLVSFLGLNRGTGLVAAGYLAINILAFITGGNAIFIFWLAPALLVWYLVSKKLLGHTPGGEFSEI